MSLRNNRVSELVAEYENAHRESFRCSVDGQYDGNDLLKMNHIDIYAPPKSIGGTIEHGRQFYFARYADLGFFAKEYMTGDSRRFFPSVYNIKIYKLVQKHFRKPKWIEIHSREYSDPVDPPAGIHGSDFEVMITDKFKPKFDDREMTIVIDPSNWQSDLKIEFSVSRELDGANSKSYKSIIINAEN